MRRPCQMDLIGLYGPRPLCMKVRALDGATNYSDVYSEDRNMPVSVRAELVHHMISTVD